MLALKKSLLFDSSSLQLSTLFVTPNKCVLLFGGNSPKVLLLFHIRNSEKSDHNCLVVTLILLGITFQVTKFLYIERFKLGTLRL